MAFHPKSLSAAIQLENQIYATTHGRAMAAASVYSSRQIADGLRIGVPGDRTGAGCEAMASALIARGEAPPIVDSTGKIWA
jgi:hypothetical protein